MTIFGWMMLAAVVMSPALNNVPTVDGEMRTVVPQRQQRLSVEKVRHFKVEIWLFFGFYSLGRYLIFKYLFTKPLKRILV